MTYRRTLRISAAGLLAALLLWLGAVLYRHATLETTELMATTDQIHLSNTAFDISSALSDTIKACQYLKQSGRFLAYVHTCLDADAPMGEQAKAFASMQDMLSIVMNSDALIRSIIITTPERRFHNSMDTLFVLHLAMDSPATQDIRLHIPEDVNYFGARNRIDLSISDYPHYAFTMDGAEDISVFVVLHETFLNDLLGGAADVFVLDGERMLYADPAAVAPGSEREAALQAFAAADSEEEERLDMRLYGAQVPQTGWSILYARGSQAYTQVYLYVFLLILALVAGSVLLSLALSRVLFQSAFRPLHTLLGALRTFKTPQEGRLLPPQAGSARGYRSLHEKVFLYLFVTVFMPVVVLTLAFSFGASHIRQEHLMDAHTAMVQNMANTFDRHLSRKETVLERIVYDAAIADAVRAPGEEGHADLLMQAIRENAYFNIDDSRLDVYDAEGALLYSNNMYAAASLEPEQARSLRWQLSQDQTGGTLLTLTASIRPNRYYLSDVWGYVRLAEDYRDIDYLMLTLSGDAQTLQFTDGDGVSLSTGRQLSIDTALAKTRDGLYVTPIEGGFCIAKGIGRSPFFIATEYRAPGFLEAFVGLLGRNTLILVIMLLLLVIAAYLLARVLLRPLGRLAQVMADMEPGNPGLRAQGFFVDEIQEIGQSFNEMADRVDSLVEDLVLSNSAKLRMESERRNAEIIALQMQINPHFLSNTIESISNMIQEGRADVARTMLYAMNDLFRYGISRTDTVITLAEELEYARAYVAIMSFRYPAVRFLWDVDAGVLGLRVVKLILQPLIENAVYHGINRVDSHGEIRIACRGMGDAVWLEVSDNGVGMDAETVDRLRADLQDARLGNVIGLFNVQARVRLRYGAGYGLDLQSAPGEGTTVRIRLPRVEG